MNFSATALAALLIAVAGLCLSVWSYLRTPQRHRHRNIEKRLADCEADMLDALDRIEKIQTQVKKIYGREAVKHARARKAEQQINGEETDEEWKQRMEREFALSRTRGVNQ